jgi:subfamily B ATP-binding cassette protein MsbA
LAEKPNGNNEKNGKNEEKKKSQLQQLKSVWPQIWELVRPRRVLLATSFVLLIINRVLGLALPYSSRLLLDRVIPRKDLHFLMLLVIGVVLATVIQAVTSYALMQLLSKEGQRAIAELRRNVQGHVGRLAVSYYDSTKTGALVSRIMSDVEGVRNLIGTGLMEFVGGILTAAIVLVLMIRISYVMTGVAVGSLAIFSLVLKRAFKVIRPIFRERGKINAEVTGRLTESLGGVRVVKGYHAEQREQKVFGQGVARILDNVMKTLDAMASMSLASTLMMGVVGAVIMYLGAHEVISGKMTAGGLFQYTMYMGFLAAPVFQLTNIGTQITEAVAGLDRTREVLGERPEDRDPERTITLGHIEGQLSFDHVDFSYEPGKPVLEDINFLSRPDTVTALVGSSGSGKSTIIGLVAAFYKPNAGRIMVDGVDLSKVRLDSYRPALGVVLQESFLFDGTIRENIAFSRPDATEEEIMRACRIAHVDEFTEKFKDKYDTIIGERGVKLSGGQRQRVSIARAVLADPRILILDEATSSLDSESEAFIQQGLRYLMQGRTTFVIAHRLSTIRQADQILVVEAGRIVERGTHQSLYAQKGRYYDLYTRQHGLESNLLLAPGEGDKIPEEQAVGRTGGGAALDPMGLIRGSGGV